MVLRHSKAQTVRSRYLDERQAVGRLYLTSCASSPSDLEQPALGHAENCCPNVEKLGRSKVEDGRLEIQGGRMGMRASRQQT